MIRVRMLENRQGICGFLCEGHAGYAEADEADVVCAGITAIAGTTVSALTDLLKLEVHYSFRSGHLECRVEDKPERTEHAQMELILETFRIGCSQIEYSYGSQYVHVEDDALQVS